MRPSAVNALALAAILAAAPLAAQTEDDAQDTPPGEVEMGSQPEAQSDDDRVEEEPDATGPSTAVADPGPFAFFDPRGEMKIAEGACGQEAAAWLNTTMMDLDGTWTMELGPPGMGGSDGPLAGAGSDSVMLQASADESLLTIGGRAFASEVPLTVVQQGQIPFASLPGDLDLTSDRAAAAIGCPFDSLPRLTARGALSADNGAAPFLLAVAVPNARTLVGMLQTGEGEDARRRLVRLLR